jgi:ATP-dependent exoDNAse (exonuclease V) alpha subunit
MQFLQAQHAVSLSATTATAANLLSSHARTAHSSFRLAARTWSHAPLTLGDRCFEQLVSNDVFIIDEYSMLTKDALTMILQRIMSAKRLTSIAEMLAKTWIILVGDHAQLPPVCNCLPSDEHGICLKHSVLMHPEFRAAYRQNIYHNLVKVHRASGAFAMFCNRVRNASRVPNSPNELKQEDIDANINHRVVAQAVVTDDTIFVCSHKADVHRYNGAQLRKIHGQQLQVADVLVHIPAMGADQPAIANPILTDIETAWVAEQKASALQYFAVGAPIRIIKNIDIERGFSNGTIGDVTAFTTKQQNVHEIRIVTSTGNTRNLTRSNIVYGFPDRRKLRVNSFPVMLAYATTVHSCQGRGISQPVVFDLECFVTGLGYIAITRTTDVANIQLLCRLLVRDLRVVNLHDLYA